MQKRSEIGFFRDRTSQMISIRNAYREKSPGFFANSGNNPEVSVNDTIFHYSFEIEAQFQDLESKLSALKELYGKQILSMTSFADQLQIESDIKSSASQITKLADSLIERIKDERYTNESRETKTFLSNLRQGYLSRIRAILIRFQKMQSDHMNKLNEIKSNYQQSNDINNNTDSADVEDIEFTQNQNRIIQQNEEEIRLRNEFFEEYYRQLDSLKILFNNLHDLIENQGQVLDRIDHNIEESLNEVKNGNKELVKAEKDQSSKCFYVYLISMLFLIIILGTIVIIRKEMKHGRNNSNSNDNGNDNGNM